VGSNPTPSVFMDKNPFEHPLFIYYKYPRYRGKLKNFNKFYHLGNPSCGDEIIFYVKVENNKIKEIGYEGYGCSISQASADILSEWALNKTIEEILNLKDIEFLEMLGGVIQTRQKCALLSLETLKRALKGGDENEGY
jgi:nitrogen fixation protein NifU and related proteins